MKLKKSNRTTLELVLYIIVLLVIVRQFFLGDYQNMFLGVMTLALFSLPKIIERTLAVNIPAALEAIILLFVFAAEILGEINNFYGRIPIWDTMLHTTTGFLAAAVGFSLIDLFNRNEKFSLKMSPYFMAFTAFCFSMTVGVMWEFLEFSMDAVLGTDTQKDWIITTINTVKLDETFSNKVVSVPVESVIVNGIDFTRELGGYLDIGLIDTMKDMFVNFIGAVVFSIIGIFYVKGRGKGKLASSLIPVVKTEEEIAHEAAQRADKKAARGKKV